MLNSKAIVLFICTAFITMVLGLSPNQCTCKNGSNLDCQTAPAKKLGACVQFGTTCLDTIKDRSLDAAGKEKKVWSKLHKKLLKKKADGGNEEEEEGHENENDSEEQQQTEQTPSQPNQNAVNNNKTKVAKDHNSTNRLVAQTIALMAITGLFCIFTF